MYQWIIISFQLSSYQLDSSGSFSCLTPLSLQLVNQELIDAGVEPSAFMDDPRWEDLNERAIAEGLETWPILLQMTAMG